uniref:Uncharacterized protein n=1 Tax=Brassica oleracea var. oleracea TaxID=109376 RepID=A0A0D3CM72_BRAOL
MFQQLLHESKVFSPLHRHHNHTFHVPNQPHSPLSHLSQRIVIHQLGVPSSYTLSPIKQQANIQHLDYVELGDSKHLLSFSKTTFLASPL